MRLIRWQPMKPYIYYMLGAIAFMAIYLGLSAGGVVSEESFLREVDKDVIAVLGIIGFALAVWQMYRTASANAAAIKAAIGAINSSRRQYDKHVVNHASRLVAEARLFVQHDEFQAAALRLQDLAELITQVSDSNEDWDKVAIRLRQMQHQFNRIAKNEIKFQSVRTKWVDLEQIIGQRLATHIGPFATFSEDMEI